MKIKLIRKTKLSNETNCPSLFASDRGTWVVVGKVIDDPTVLNQIGDMLPGERAVEVPLDVLHDRG